jgi:L,D-transpeptidase YcbB
MEPVKRRRCLGMLLAFALGIEAVSAQGVVPPIAGDSALAAAIESRVLAAGGGLGAAAAQREPLRRLYQADGYQARWLDGDHRPNHAAAQALDVLSEAATHGLDPADYRAPEMADLAASLKTRADSADAAAAIDFELGMSLSMLRYLRDLHVGRVDPRAVRFRVPSRDTEHDYAAVLRSALADGRLHRTAAEMAPDLAQYRSLRKVLASYRSLAADAALPALPQLASSVRPGDHYPAPRALHRRLVALGDLPANAAWPDDAPLLYAGALVEGIKRFQHRHGLADDGVLGPSTQVALQVPLARRARQIELAMERLRWLPHLGTQPFVAINIPMFRLWARDPADARNGAPLDMAVIVGRALATQTPVFVDEMTHLIFRPYWNVPRSIVRNEILPALQRDPTYLQRHDMEIVRGQGDDARPVAASAENISLLRQGALRLRQRPGPRNSLGLVKFVFPNDADVYMHGTPSQQLFARTRRDFSHGCVRLEDPVTLAEWALKDQPGWTRERIVAAMQGTKTAQVNLARPVRVILYYVTAAVTPADGAIRFADDLYGHDRKLDAALAARRSR